MGRRRRKKREYREEEREGEGHFSRVEASLLEQEHGSKDNALRWAAKKINALLTDVRKQRDEIRDLKDDAEERGDALFDEDTLKKYPELAAFDDAKALNQALLDGKDAVSKRAFDERARQISDFASKSGLNPSALGLFAKANPDVKLSVEELLVEGKKIHRVFVQKGSDGSRQSIEDYIKAHSGSSAEQELALLRSSSSEDQGEKGEQAINFLTSPSSKDAGKKDDMDDILSSFLSDLSGGDKNEDKKAA